MICPTCDGTGEIDVTRPCTPREATGGLSELTGGDQCETCHGDGVIEDDPRERGDDDGVEYGDPRDDRLKD